MDFQIVLMTVSLLLMVSGLLVIRTERLYLTEPLIAMLIGLALSSFGSNLIDINRWEHPERFMELASVLTISMALMSTAYRVQDNYPVLFYRTQAVILLLLMPLMGLASGLLAYFILDMPLGIAFLLGAVITPTDPVVSSTIVSGKFAERYLPKSIRQTLSFESAANDGIALPLVLLVLFLLGQDSADSLVEWAIRVIARETVGAIVIGGALGYGFGKFMHVAHQRGWMNTKALLSFSIAFGFFVLSLAEVLHTNGIIAVFVGGLIVMQAVSENEELEGESVQEMIERLFTVPVFFFLGLYLPVDAWFSIGWPLLGFAVSIMLFRRLPALCLLKPLLPRFRSKYDIAFLGWFGPIGVAALFYSMYVLQQTPYRRVWEIASFVIFFSTLVHGLTSLPLSRWYAHQKKATEDDV